jgi:hypothetical protein
MVRVLEVNPSVYGLLLVCTGRNRPSPSIAFCLAEEYAESHFAVGPVEQETLGDPRNEFTRILKWLRSREFTGIAYVHRMQSAKAPGLAYSFQVKWRSSADMLNSLRKYSTGSDMTTVHSITDLRQRQPVIVGDHQGDPHSRSETVSTRVWMEEFQALEGLYNAPANCSPKLRYPDLISGCVSLIFDGLDPVNHIFTFLHTKLVLRDQETARRQEDIWRPQYLLLLALQKSERNRHPHPQFKLDHFTTACVALALVEPRAAQRISDYARRNIAQRAASRVM